MNKEKYTPLIKDELIYLIEKIKIDSIYIQA